MPAGLFRLPNRARPAFLTLILVAVGAWSVWEAQVDPGALLSREGRENMARFVTGMLPPETSRRFLGSMVVPVLETVQISIAGMLVAILVGAPLGILATSTLSWSGILHERHRASQRLVGFVPYAVARGLLSIFRSIPEFVWGMMFVRVVGLGPFAGVLAIGVAYGGMLGKVYSEILENVNPRPAETLQAAGAPRVAVLAYGVLPSALTPFISYTLYRWECAIRASAILGFVGAGGLGQQIELSMRMFNFHEVITLLLMLWVLVTVVETVSATIRRAVA